MDNRLAARERLFKLIGEIDEETYNLFCLINPYVQRFKYVPTALFIVGLIAYAVWYHVLK